MIGVSGVLCDLDYGGNGVGSCLERVEAKRSGWRPNEWIRVETNR